MSTLKEKIVSEEQLRVAMDTARQASDSEAYYYDHVADRVRRMQNLPSRQHVEWWAVREECRTMSGVYSSSTALEKLNNVFPIFAHISTEDKTMVAFTPDRTAGLMDRQIKMAPGRLFSKFMPIATERYIQDLVAEHNAEVCTEIEFVTGENIALEYQKFTGSIAACMTKPYFNDGRPHPAAIYNTPDIKLAVLRDSSGNVSARSLVRLLDAERNLWGYIRAYGTPALAKRLMAEGMRPTGWADIKFPAIPMPGKESLPVTVGPSGNKVVVQQPAFVFPYLDANGGGTDSGYRFYSDGEKIICVTEGSTMFRRLESWGLSLPYGNGTDGYKHFPVITPDTFVKVCGLSGKKFDLMTSSPSMRLWLAEGATETIEAEYSAIAELQGIQVRMWNPPTARWVDAYTTKTNILNTPEGKMPNHRPTLEKKGFRVLSEAFYPEDREMKLQVLTAVTDDGHVIMVEDAVKIVKSVEGTFVVATMHKSQLTAKLNKLHANRRGEVVYVADGVETFKTATGRRVHPAYNKIVKLHTGEYEFADKVTTQFVMGVSVAVRKGETLDTTQKEVIDFAWSRWTGANLDTSFSQIEVQSRVLRTLANVAYTDLWLSSADDLADVANLIGRGFSRHSAFGMLSEEQRRRLFACLLGKMAVSEHASDRAVADMVKTRMFDVDFASEVVNAEMPEATVALVNSADETVPVPDAPDEPTVSLPAQALVLPVAQPVEF